MKIKNRCKTALHLAVLTALAFSPLGAKADGHLDTTQDSLDPGAWTSVLTGTIGSVQHIYDAEHEALKSYGGTTKPDSFNSLTVNIGTAETQAIAQQNVHGIYITGLPESANNSFTFEGPLTINVNKGSFFQANLYGVSDSSSGTSAQDMLNLSSGNIVINIYGTDDSSQKEGSVYGYYANSGSFTNTTLKDISIFSLDSEEVANDATNTGGIYGIHFDKTNSTLNAGNVLIDVDGGFDSKGTYGYHSDQGTATGSVVNIGSITLIANNYQGGEGYLRGIEKQGSETLNVGNVSVTGYGVTEGRITGVFSRGGDINIEKNVQLYIRDVNDGNPQDDNLTGIWLARGGNINVGGNVVVTYEEDKGFNPTFDQNITGIGIMKVDRVLNTPTQTQNASVTVGGNLVVQLAGNAESIGLKNHSVYGTVNNGQNSSITLAEGSKRYLYFGTDTNYVDGEQTFSSLNSKDEPTTFQGSFSNFDAIVVTNGSSLQLSLEQTHALVGDDDLFATTVIKNGSTTVGFAPVLNYVDFLKGNRETNNVSAGVINGIVSMGGVLSMASGTTMDIRQGGSADIWLLQNENDATINVDGTLKLASASVTATANGAVSHPTGSGEAYNKGDIIGNGKLVLQTATPTETVTYNTYTYSGVSNTTDITAGNSVFVNSGLIGVSTLEIGNGFELQNTGDINVGNLTATQAIIESTGSISVAGTMELIGTHVTTTHPISAGSMILNSSAIDVEDTPFTPPSSSESDDGQSVTRSIITTSKPIETGSLVLQNSTLTSTSTVTVFNTSSVSTYAKEANQPNYAGSLRLEQSELDAESITVSKEISLSNSKINVSGAIYAGSIQADNATILSQTAIAVAGNMAIADSNITAFSATKDAGISLLSYDIYPTEVISAKKSIAVSNSTIDTNFPIVAENLSLTSSTLKTNESVLAVGTINVSNDSSVTTSGSTSATTLAISGGSKYFSDGNIETDILTVNNGTLVSGQNSGNVAIKTDNFTLNNGEVYITNGTFDVHQTASLTGGTFVLGSESSTVEVQLNPVATNKSSALNLNTAFEINKGSKLGLGTQTVLSATKAIFASVGIDDTAKTILAVNKPIVTGNIGYIGVGYGTSTSFSPNLTNGIALASTTSNLSGDSGLRFGGDSVLAIEVNSNTVVPNLSSSSVFTTTDSNSSVVVDKGATVVLYGDLQPGLYNITKGYEIADQTINGWDHQNEGEVVVYVKDAANLDWTFERGTYLKSDGYDDNYVWVNVISHEDVQDVYPDISIPDISNDAFDNCKARSGEFICGIFRDDQLESDQKTEIINTASAIAFTGGVLASAMNDLNYGFGALYNHLTMDSDTFAAQGKLWPSQENNNFWLDVMGHWTQSKHLNATGLKNIGYKDSTYGFILGYDHKFNDSPFVVGVAFSYLNGNLKSNGDYVRTTNKHQSYGAHVYANYSPNEYLNLIGSLHWLRNNGDLNQHINTETAKAATASAHTDLFAIGLRAETTLNVGILSVIPHIEPRYIYGKTREFDTKVDNRRIWDTKFGGNSLFQIPVGVALRTDIKTESGWNWRPTLDVQVIPQVGSTNQRMKIKNSEGVSDVIYGQYQGKFAAEAKFGMSVDKGPWTFGVKYGFGGGLKGRYEHGFNLEGRFRW